MNKINKRSYVPKILTSLGLALFATQAFAAPQAVPGEFVVKMSASANVAMMSQLGASGVSVKEQISEQDGLYLARVSNPRAVLMKLQPSTGFQTMSIDRMSTEELQNSVQTALQTLPGVDYVEPNYIYTATVEAVSAPNDGSYGRQWALHNTFKAGADIHAHEAWATSKGSSKVIVAVVDTGIDYSHPDLGSNMWTKPGTSSVHGINAVTGVEDPMDDTSFAHGTHCSGIIGAVGNNEIGISGVNWNVGLMGAKFLTRNGSGSLAGAIKAIDYAVANGARVINASWGGGPYSQALYDSINRAGKAGILFVAAAGNDGTNNDSRAVYPAGYQLDNVVAVAATDKRDQLADYSNFGVRNVLLAAPGSGILSTVATHGYGELDGTSMAAPHVSGAVALLLSVVQNLSPSEIKQRLAAAVDVIPSLQGRVKSGGRLNVAKLLSAN